MPASLAWKGIEILKTIVINLSVTNNPKEDFSME